MAKSAKLADMSDADLLELLDETKTELFNLRFQIVTGQLENHASLKTTRRQVARIKTEVRMRQILAAEAASQEA